MEKATRHRIGQQLIAGWKPEKNGRTTGKTALNHTRAVIRAQLTQLTGTNIALDSWHKIKVELIALTNMEVPEIDKRIKKRAPLCSELKIAIKENGNLGKIYAMRLSRWKIKARSRRIS